MPTEIVTRNPKAVHKEKKYISVSEAKVLSKCPRLYYLTKIEKNQDAFTSNYMIRGAAIHKAIEMLLKEPKPDPYEYANAVQDYYLEAMSECNSIHGIQFDIWSDMKKDMQFCADVTRRFIDVIYPYLDPIAQELSCMTDIVQIDLPVFGVIDYVGYYNNKQAVEIVDWKTGSSGISDYFLQNDLQLRTYNMLMQHGRPVISRFKLDFDATYEKLFGYMPTRTRLVNLGELISTKPWQSKKVTYTIQYTEKDITNTIAEIREFWRMRMLLLSEKLFPKNTGTAQSCPCDSCPMQYICEKE